MKYCVTYSADEVLPCVNSIDVEAETPEQAEQKVVRELQEEAIPEGKSDGMASSWSQSVSNPSKQ